MGRQCRRVRRCAVHALRQQRRRQRRIRSGQGPGVFQGGGQGQPVPGDGNGQPDRLCTGSPGLAAVLHQQPWPALGNGHAAPLHKPGVDRFHRSLGTDRRAIAGGAQGRSATAGRPAGGKIAALQGAENQGRRLPSANGQPGRGAEPFRRSICRRSSRRQFQGWSAMAETQPAAGPKWQRYQHIEIQRRVH
ncbi:hypothetical protein D3C80_1274740 [compost metagenome]